MQTQTIGNIRIDRVVERCCDISNGSRESGAAVLRPSV